MLVMIPNIQNLKGNQNEERYLLHYNTIRLLRTLYTTPKVKKGLGFLSFLLTR